MDTVITVIAIAYAKKYQAVLAGQEVPAVLAIAQVSICIGVIVITSIKLIRRFGRIHDKESAARVVQQVDN